LPRLLFAQQPPIHTLVVVGLATDYCVMSSAIDSVKFQLRTIIVEDGVRGVDEASVRKSCSEMKDWGVEFVQTDQDLLKLLS
jgi:nicotinamidase-related amidase